MKHRDFSKTWYHGSPLVLSTLRKGSTITQDRGLARVFSHKPTLISISDEGRMRHNGSVPGVLYIISETVEPDDVAPHPRSAMECGKEWLTRRGLRVTLIGPTEIVAEERLTGDEPAELERRPRAGRE